ncbi:hypothetical protein GNI_034320 [Gregarina niphandrodes]|uniref:Uncharacterized protein n=1 Tax=Gregarina niphandrodes TaxID=110365 RepID=A0A023BAT0_GRENI|nr:hypothetical protein GNI_034320 [Gregarina niphandrodes]EZG78614.1 hypothetical protein GNI_034320 [Gregarina niphandrodes]|eukprot:XP_011129241.1 hypothetical protein GNI_034320 [Gregarina niphandrodes]
MVSSGQNYFEGTVAINNVPHTISCSCQEALNVDPKFALASWNSDAKTCAVTSSKIVLERPAAVEVENALTDDEVSEYYGQPRVMKIVPLAMGEGKNILPYSEMYCADSRWTSARPFSLGGDLGELLLVLNSFETVVGGTGLSDETIVNVLTAWVSTLSTQQQADGPALTFCTDREALNQLASDLGVSSGLGLQQAPESQRPALIQGLSSDVSHHGDVLWRCLIGSPETYQIRAQLIKSFLNAYFTLLWAAQYPQSIGVHIHSGSGTSSSGSGTSSSGSGTSSSGSGTSSSGSGTSSSSSGIPTPGAVLAVQEPDGCSNHAVAISPTQQTLDTVLTAYIYNPQAASERREQLVKFIAPLVNGDGTTTLPVAHRKAQTWAETCLSSTFPDTPIYTVQLQQ